LQNPIKLKTVEGGHLCPKQR